MTVLEMAEKFGRVCLLPTVMVMVSKTQMRPTSRVFKIRNAQQVEILTETVSTTEMSFRGVSTTPIVMVTASATSTKFSPAFYFRIATMMGLAIV